MSDAIQEVIGDHSLNLIPTSMRFSFSGLELPGIADMLQVDGDDIFRRVLVVDRDIVGTDYHHIWATARKMGGYILPKVVPEMVTRKAVTYQIPSTARPLVYENIDPSSEVHVALSSSLGRLMAELAQRNGISTVSRESLAVIDFVEEDIEPVLFLPGLVSSTDSQDPEEVSAYFFPSVDDAVMRDVFVSSYTATK